LSRNVLDTLFPAGVLKTDTPPTAVHTLFDHAAGDLAALLPAGADDEPTRSAMHALSAYLHRAEATGADNAPPLRVGDVIAVLRRHPIASTRLDGARWSTGLEASRHIGPIHDRLGRPLWVDLYRSVRQLRFVRSPGGAPFLALPIAQVGPALISTTLRAGQPLQLSAGSLWFATGLVSTAPAGIHTGVRIGGGSLVFGADIALGGEEVVVPAGVSIDLRVELDPPVPAAATGAFASTRFEAPKGLALSIRAAAATIEVVGNAGLRVWGDTVELAPAPGPAQYRADLNRLIVPMTAVPEGAAAPGLAVRDSDSKLFIASGEAEIGAAGLALPAASIAPADLGIASGVGALMLTLRRGLHARWTGEAAKADLGEAVLLLDESRLAFSAGAALANGRATRPVLVHASAPAEWVMSRRDRAPVHYFAGADGAELVIQSVDAELRLPMPVDVTGNRVAARLPSAQSMILLHADGNRDMLIGGLCVVAKPPRPLAFGLTNAVLRATAPLAAVLIGRLGEDDAIVNGRAILAYGLASVLPSLPDPYAANLGLGQRSSDGLQGVLLSNYGFSPTGEKLEFVLPPGAAVDPSALQSAQAATDIAAAPNRASAFGAERGTSISAINDRLGDVLDFERQPKIVLLDVSSNASRFGVAMRPPNADARESIAQQPLKPTAVRDLDLSVDGRLLVLLTLPAVQWEPVRSQPGPEPFPDEVRFANSGVPTIIDVPSVNLVPMNPLTAYQTIVDNFAEAAPRPANARFTLPFGMLARTRLAAPVGGGRGAKVGEVRPVADDLLGAHQLSLEARHPALPAGETPALPGYALQLPVALPTDGSPATSILGPSVTMIFNGYLGPGEPTALVPVTRIDLSGHGESLFSDWKNPDDPETGVSKAEFQVLNGRAAHEVVQVKSILLPYFIPVVRTITLERRGNAVFTRQDSGWVAVRDGAYRATPGSGIATHPGLVLRATRIGNIRETGTSFSVAGGEFVAAYFDTDLIVDGAAAPVPARRQIGYVKLSIPALTPPMYAALIEKVGPMGGAIDATIAIAGGRHRMRLHRVGIGIAGPEFAMAAWGSLAFPGGGEWSVLETENALDAPAPVAADRGLPIIRQGAAGAPAIGPYRFADPEDLFDVANPGRDYGILHSMGTQRAFFRRPRIEAASPHRIVSSERPVIADPLILATAIGPFPRQADAIPLPSAAFALEVRPDQSWRLDAPATFPAAIPRRTVRSAGTVRSDIDYSGATVTYTFDTAAPVPWRFALENALKIMAHTSMGDLMSMVANIDAEAGRATRFADPGLRLGGPFDIVQDLLTIMQDLGIPAKPDVRMTNGWSLKVGLKVPFVDAMGDDFEVIPGEPLPTIIFADTGVKVELAVAPDADEAELEVAGSPMFGIKSVPGLYVVAIIKFKLKLSTKSGTTYGVLIGVGVAYKFPKLGPIEFKAMFALTFFAVFGDTVLGYGVGFLLKASAEIPPIVSVDISLEGKLARLIVQKDLPDETVFQIAKLAFAVEISVFLIFSISVEYETKKIEVIRGPLLESDAPDVL
jgi:hypothetical protein